MELFWDLLLDAAIDTAKMLPFLLVTFWLMEYLEHRPAASAQRLMNNSSLAPIAGGLLGLLPQCGFSAAAASLYSRGAITVGTLMAVFISTSDEAVPMLLAN
ncbi:MAG: putative manganese transporter, partial [Angelakisella sp.]